MAKYQGHRSWNAWNVSLWINNDDGIYRRAVDLAKRLSLNNAAHELLAELPERTPDGAKYNFTCIREALRGIV